MPSFQRGERPFAPQYVPCAAIGQPHVHLGLEVDALAGAGASGVKVRLIADAAARFAVYAEREDDNGLRTFERIEPSSDDRAFQVPTTSLVGLAFADTSQGCAVDATINIPAFTATIEVLD